MNRIPKVNKFQIIDFAPTQFRKTLKQSLIRCKEQAFNYHKCVKENMLETDHLHCQQQFFVYKKCLNL